MLFPKITPKTCRSPDSKAAVPIRQGANCSMSVFLNLTGCFILISVVRCPPNKSAEKQCRKRREAGKKDLWKWPCKGAGMHFHTGRRGKMRLSKKWEKSASIGKQNQNFNSNSIYNPYKPKF